MADNTSYSYRDKDKKSKIKAKQKFVQNSLPRIGDFNAISP